MNGRRVFLDTAFVLALHARADQHHQRAVKWLQAVRQAREVWTTEAVLIEVGNAFSASNRAWAVNFNRDLYRTPNVRIVPITDRLLKQAWRLYADRPDKHWGLTDCISFTVMSEQSLTEALTPDHHFVQAGFVALLREDPR
jgi:predicted nucleic acid-binding protein